VKLNNLAIAPKLGILLGITLLGLSAAGVLAGYLMRQEMLNAKTEQMHSIVDMARNMAIALQKDVDAGKLTKEQAIAEWAARANSMTYNNGDSYLFGSTMDGITVLAPDRKTIGQNRLDVATGGRYIGRKWHDGVAAKGEHTLYYDYKRPGRSSSCPRPPMQSRFPAGTCMSAPASISTMSTPSSAPLPGCSGLPFSASASSPAALPG
jgi:methyl-accepting chemotaxis protein